MLFCAPAIIAYPKLMKIPRYSIMDYAYSAFGGNGVALTSKSHPELITQLVISSEEFLHAMALMDAQLTISGYDERGNPVLENINVGGLKINKKPVPW